MNTATPSTTTRRLQMVLGAFFVLTFLSALVIYIADPPIYTQTLALVSSPGDQHPLAATAFLLALAVFITFLLVGVLRRWRWLFWLLLLVFSASILDFPVTMLQFAGVLPVTYPTWYSLFRLGVSAVEVAIAIWMIQVLRREGVWALGKKTPQTIAPA